MKLLVVSLLAAAPIGLTTGCAVAHHQETAQEYGHDATITARIKAEMYKDPAVKGTEVNVSTMNGVVQLSGFVDTAEAKERAGEIARSVPGVVDVRNDLLLPTGR